MKHDPPERELFDAMRLDWSCETDEDTIARVRDYWRGKCQGQLMPSRRDINPADLRGVLSQLQLYDLIDGGKAIRVRLLGTGIVEALGDDPTGRTITRAANDQLTRRMFALIDRVTKRKGALIVRAERTAVERVNFMKVEAIYLPLADDGMTPDTLLAATVFSDPDEVWSVD